MRHSRSAARTACSARSHVIALAMSMVAMLCVGVSGAQVSLNVADCSAGPPNHAFTNTCTVNTGTAAVLSCSIVMPPVTLHQFVGAQGILDVFANSATIPDWWRLDACRASGFVLAADAGTGRSCPTLWDTHPGAGANLSSMVGVPFTSSIRYLLGQMLASADAYDLTGDGESELVVFRLTVLRDKTVGEDSCAGCLVGACFILNEIHLQRLTDTPATGLHLSNPFPGASDYLSYNGGVPGCGWFSTSARNRTWGAIEALYR